MRTWETMNTAHLWKQLWKMFSPQPFRGAHLALISICSSLFLTFYISSSSVTTLCKSFMIQIKACSFLPCLLVVLVSLNQAVSSVMAEALTYLGGRPQSPSQGYGMLPKPSGLKFNTGSINIVGLKVVNLFKNSGTRENQLKVTFWFLVAYIHTVIYFNFISKLGKVTKLQQKHISTYSFTFVNHYFPCLRFT